jgi:hypothetical protein
MDANFNTIHIAGMLPTNPQWGTIDIHNSLMATQHSHSKHTQSLGERTSLYSAIQSQVPSFIHTRSLDGHIKKSHVAVRYLSTSSGGPNSGNGKTSAEKNSNEKIAKEEPVDASEEGKASRLSAVVGSVGQRLPHLQWHVPDLVSVYGIFMLIAAIVVTPIVFT